MTFHDSALHLHAWHALHAPQALQTLHAALQYALRALHCIHFIVHYIHCIFVHTLHKVCALPPLLYIHYIALSFTIMLHYHALSMYPLLSSGRPSSLLSFPLLVFSCISSLLFSYLLLLISGWWFGTFLFFHILGIIILDFLFFHRLAIDYLHFFLGFNCPWARPMRRLMYAEFCIGRPF